MIVKKIAVFCSNPVNGGTAKMFTEVINALALYHEKYNFLIVPCVNRDNSVEIYNSIPTLKRIDVYSEENICGELKEGLGKIQRVGRRLNRSYKYASWKKKNIETMCRFLHQNKIDIVMIHNGGYCGDDLCNQMLEASYKAKISERIMIFHSDFQKSFLQKMRYWIYDMKLCKYSTKLATVSEFTRNRILQNSYINKKIEVLYNGISFENTLSEIEKKQKIKYKDKIRNIGMIGNFMRHKGQMYLLKAVKILKEISQFEFMVTLIGNIYDKKYYEECLDYISQNNLHDFVRICHGIYNAGEYTDLFDFIVVPTVQDESFGLISVEAMKNGVPVIAFACGGIPEVVIDGQDGLIVNVGKTDALVKAMDQLMNNSALCKELGDRAREDYNRKFTFNEMGKRYIKFIDLQGEIN